MQRGLVGETAAMSKLSGVITSFIFRIILSPCSRTTTLIWGGVMMRGLGGIVGMLDRPVSYCNCNT